MRLPFAVFAVFVGVHPAVAQLRPLSQPVPPPMSDWLYDENDHSPDWSPDGTRILVTRRDRGRSYQLFFVNPDGTNLHAITTGPGNNQQGTFSPDGSRIAFLSNRDGTWAIYVMNVDGSGLRRLTTDSASVGERPAWSPDGRRIAYYSDRNGHNDIWVMNADGTNHVALTDDSTPDANPAWSPDGSLIAFDRTDGDREIWVMRADGRGMRRLTNSPGYDGYPAWSPDGSRIAFLASRVGLWSIFTMHADGSDVRRLTNAPDWNFDPEWSPDGSMIVFDSRRDGRRGTYVMNADGSEERKITNTESSEFAAVARESGAQEAVRRFHAAVVAQPHAVFFLPVEVQLLARAFRDAGRLGEAALLLETAIAHHPTFYAASADLRAVDEALGRPTLPSSDSIVAAFDRDGVQAGAALLARIAYRYPGRRPVSASTVARLADARAAAGDRSGAIDIYDIGVAMYPDRVAFHRRLGDLQAEAGDLTTARAHWRRAAELDPDDVGLQRRLREAEGETP